jgi:hypothetical protein
MIRPRLSAAALAACPSAALALLRWLVRFTIERRHLCRGIAIAGRRIEWHRAVDLSEIVAGECQLHCTQRFAQAFPPTGAHERRHVHPTR